MDAPRLRKKFRTTLLSIVVATGFSLNTYADGLPDLGEISQAEVSPHAERKAGEAIMQEIRALEPNYLDDPEVASYLNRLGGRLGATLGKTLAELARHHQVICVTHLPQMASHACRQWVIRKTVEDGRARTTITPLDDAERVAELAAMLRGASAAEGTRQEALSMLLEAQGTG